VLTIRTDNTTSAAEAGSTGLWEKEGAPKYRGGYLSKHPGFLFSSGMARWRILGRLGAKSRLGVTPASSVLSRLGFTNPAAALDVLGVSSTIFNLVFFGESNPVVLDRPR
jgi:hypothetical protein